MAPDRIRPTYNHQGPGRSPNSKQTQKPSVTHGSGSDSGVHSGSLRRFPIKPTRLDAAARRNRTAQVMAAASRKEEERNERVVRGLLKLPPNRRCINCNGIVRAPTLIRSCDPRFAPDLECSVVFTALLAEVPCFCVLSFA
jgi:hypothetical protein